MFVIACLLSLTHSLTHYSFTIIQPSYTLSTIEPFREPVDYKALGLHDYPQIIKKPMDLGTIQKKLQKKEYSTIHQVADDVRLVWNNCMTYNADGSDFYLLAQGLAKKWEEKYAKFLSEFGIFAPPQTPAKENNLSLEEKRNFARNLYKLNKEQVGLVLVELDEKCPSCLVKNSAEDEYEINVDKISPNVFAEIQAFVHTSMASLSDKKTKKTKSTKKQKT